MTTRLLLALCVTVLPISALPLRSIAAQPGTGARYGARDARTCTVPAPRGTPNVAQVTQAFICASENEYDGRLLYLIENVRVQVGRGRPFQMRTDAYKDVDPSGTIYPIRGSFTKYQCSLRSHEQAMGSDPNTNCTASAKPSASGVCYTTTFGDLRCDMYDINAPLSSVRVAPPKA